VARRKQNKQTKKKRKKKQAKKKQAIDQKGAEERKMFQQEILRLQGETLELRATFLDMLLTF